jgi:APA family basic amino acid/polyamine antiporter
MTKDGLFFKSISRVHPRFRTPVNAILIQSAWAVGLLLLWVTLEDLITYVVFSDWIFFGLTAVAIFIFRHRRKDMPRPYRTLGYPVVPLVFIIFTFLFVIVTLIEKPMHALAGLMLILIALPIYYYFKKANAKELDSAHLDSG